MAIAWRKVGGKNKHVRRLGIMADQAFRVNPGVSARIAWPTRSEVVAALELAGLGDDFATNVRLKRAGSEEGVAAKVNLYYGAEALVQELEGAEVTGVICQGEHGWEVV